MKIYLDNAASTMPHKEVLDTYVNVSLEMYSNSSAVHNDGLTANELFKASRSQIANLLKVRDEEVIFTSGATESINTAIKGICFYHQNRGKHIISTVYEHPSVINTLKYLEERFDFTVTYLEDVTAEAISNALSEETILVSVSHTQGELGIVFDIEGIASVLKSHRAFLHVDMCQSLGKINVGLSDIDLASFSMHKLHGLKGCGILFKKRDVKLDALVHGANQQELRSGTIPLASVVASAKGLRISLDNIEKNYGHISEIWDYTFKLLNLVNGVCVNSHSTGNKYIMNFSVLDVNTTALLQLLNENEIYVSSQTACRAKDSYSKVVYSYTSDMDRASSSFRISFSKFISTKDIEKFGSVLEKSIVSVLVLNWG